MVTSTSLNIDPSAKISRQRQNTSISDGNRNRGKNSDANCQSAITTMKGSTDSHTRFAAARQHGRRRRSGLGSGLAHLPGAW